ncbi:MAG: formyl transferase [Rhizobiales bacterium]|nr:formyl transferase [Hyphomicrobiales bacterium]
MTARTDILFLGGENPTTWIAYNRLVREFGAFPCIVEERLSRRTMARYRMRKLGILTVASQVAFVALIRPWLSRAAQARIDAICRESDLERTPPMAGHIHHVESVNSAACRDLIGRYNPKVIVVNGTRIIGKGTLASASAILLNTHQGVTPQYRGAHGGYWALYKNDPAHCGVTVHLVDSGIDTGNIVSQALIEPTANDNFCSYPFLQTAAALPLLKQAVADALLGRLESRGPEGTSGLWYHPGFFQYLAARMRGVK